MSGLRRSASADPVDVALRGADVPPSTAGAVPMRGASHREVVALSPVDVVVAALLTRSSPVRDLVPVETRGGELGVGQLVLERLVVVVGRGDLAPDHPAVKRRAGLHRQRVGADVPRFELERAVERRFPVVDRLARSPVDQIEIDALDPGVARVGARAHDTRRLMGSAEPHEHVLTHRLDTEAHAVHAGRGVGGELRGVDRIRVALDRDLGTLLTRDRIEDARQRVGREQGGRTTSEEDARRAREPAFCTFADELSDARVDVVVDQGAAIGPCCEVAVVAARRAERDVHVDGDGRRRRGHQSSSRKAATKASWGTSTRPICFMRFLPSFWRSSSLRLRVMSPP